MSPGLAKSVNAGKTLSQRSARVYRVHGVHERERCISSRLYLQFGTAVASTTFSLAGGMPLPLRRDEHGMPISSVAPVGTSDASRESMDERGLLMEAVVVLVSVDDFLVGCRGGGECVCECGWACACGEGEGEEEDGGCERDDEDGGCVSEEASGIKDGSKGDAFSFGESTERGSGGSGGEVGNPFACSCISFERGLPSSTTPAPAVTSFSLSLSLSDEAEAAPETTDKSPDDLTVRIVSLDPFLRSVATLELDAELLVFLCSLPDPNPVPVPVLCFYLYCYQQRNSRVAEQRDGSGRVNVALSGGP
ncbi:hypothetical protein JR316_0011759 [Psilocybe cubensis]|uniref:Uncharacterized protein n=2 Tax=Psilocybe cubensis TaxID=181762 RepID=A0ACB8GKX7_PSICU|nr:hypothetical protein JR316_0011759 [Psilocybe cubensis]KAH9476188.1 hypothetical protein JR316_0011759 [Psilocybe cubensis]